MPLRLMLGTALLIFALMKILVAGPVIDALLVRSFQQDSGEWARYITQRISGFEGCVAGAGEHDEFSGLTAMHGDFALTLQTALQAGRIHQIDVTIPGCNCQVTLVGSVENRIGRASSDDVTERSLEALHLLLAGRISGRFFVGDGAPPLLLDLPTMPSSPHAVHEVVHTHEGGTLNGTRWFGVTTLATPAIAGQTLVLRLITEQTPTARGLELMFWAMAAGAALLTALLVFFGSRKIERTRISGEMSDQQARYLAAHDSLTGLYNRHGFGVRAKAMIDAARQDGSSLFLAQIDLDKFKDINDFHGHAAGDDILIAVAEMIRKNFPSSALAARLGGDEFAVLCRSDALSASCSDFLSSISTKVRATIGEGDSRQTLASTVSIGYAMFPKDGSTLFELMKSSDLALYNVKRNGRAFAGAFYSDLARAFERRLWEVDGVLAAAEIGLIVPHYQPIINAKTGKIEALESLVRWRHPDLGVLSPARFHNALKDPVASRAVTHAMLDRITSDLVRWRRDGHRMSVGLNVTETDLKSEEFPGEVCAALERHGLPRHSLAIEVTEQAANRLNLETLAETLQKIRDQGMFIALDDFGTDGSSLTILKALPCTAMKIDKSFVSGMTQDSDDLSIVQALISLAHDLDLKVIAEGVETEEQCRILTDLGADLLQGHLFSKAVSAEEIAVLLNTWHVAPNRPSRAA